jgi:hypothetical protein
MGDDKGQRRLALLVATSTYDDAGLAGLVSPAQDAAALAEVLAAPEIGRFTVSSVEDATSAEICQSIEDFTAERDRADLVLLYMSCHGLKDEQGRLYFAARNTRRDRLRSTAVPAGFVNEILFACQSRRKVLLLDCCYSGAFAKGLAVKADASVHTADHFDARGLVVLTASDATQYAFEGDALSGRAAPSIFTASLAGGLRTGAADVDGDGLVSVDDLYEYARRRLSEQPRPQSPRKWEFDVAGSIVLARSPVGAHDAARSVTVRDQLPAILPADGPEQTGTTRRIRQGQWWLGALLFLTTSIALCLLLVTWVHLILRQMPNNEYLPSGNAIPLAAGLGGAAWALAIAGLDATRISQARWYDLHLTWLTTLAAVVQPSGVGDFLRSARAAVPFNVTVTVLASIAAAALGYTFGNGSQARDLAFQLSFTLLTAAAVITHLGHRGVIPAKATRGRPDPHG